MSSTPGPRGLDWRAIAAGAGASIAIGMSASMLLRSLLANGGMDLAYGTMVALNGLVAVVADVVGGTTAGLMAKRRGAMHGLMAMLLASAFGLVASAVMLSRMGQFAMMLGVGYWVQWLAMAIAGVAVGTLSGWAAARIAAAKST